MSSDNSSIDTPVFTVRTLAWLRTNWLKGISRITARVLILVGLAMVQMLHDGRPGATLPIVKTRHGSRSGPLPLGWPNRSARGYAGLPPGAPPPRALAVDRARCRCGTRSREFERSTFQIRF